MTKYQGGPRRTNDQDYSMLEQFGYAAEASLAEPKEVTGFHSQCPAFALHVPDVCKPPTARAISESGDTDNLPDDTLNHFACIHALSGKPDRRRLFDQSAGRNPFGLSDADTATFYLAHISAHQSQSPELRRATIMTDNGEDNNGKVDNGSDGKSTCKHTYERLNAVKTAAQKKYGPARQGASKAKALEKLQSVGPILNPEEATVYQIKIDWCRCRKFW